MYSACSSAKNRSKFKKGGAAFCSTSTARFHVICDGGIKRGTHVLKALSVGAKACSGGRWYLYALAGAGQAGVERALSNMQSELVRDMKLMGAKKLSDLSRANLRFR